MSGIFTTVGTVIEVVAHGTKLLFAFLSAFWNFAVMVSNILAILLEVFAEVIVTSLKLLVSIVRFVTVLVEGILSILFPMVPIARLIGEFIFSILSMFLSTLKFIILLPFNFSVEIVSLFSYIIHEISTFFSSFLEMLLEMFQNVITHKDLIIQKSCETRDLILLNIAEILTFFSNFIHNSLTFVSSTFLIVFNHIQEIIITILPNAFLTIYFVILVLLCVLVFGILLILKHHTRIRVRREFIRMPEPPLPNEWDSDESNESDYALFNEEYTNGRGDHSGVAPLPDDPRSLQRLLEDERDQKLCVVCQDRQKCVVLMPCKHLCLCDACAREINRSNQPNRQECPLCRNRIEKAISVYT